MNFVLPYPISANRYWRTYLPKGHRVPVTTVSKEAIEYKRAVQWIVTSAGIHRPTDDLVAVDFALYPKRPKDWAKRVRKDPKDWHRTVQCIDLDNAQKVMLDALKGFVFTDDDQVFFICGKRCAPDEKGPRIEVVLRRYSDETA